MIFGYYPCCGESLTLSMPDRTPTFAKEHCPNCGELVWHKFSRIAPESFTDSDFHNQWVVDEDTMTITRRDSGEKPISPELQRLVDDVFKESTRKAVEAWENALIFGDSSVSHLSGLGAAIPAGGLKRNAITLRNPYTGEIFWMQS